MTEKEYFEQALEISTEFDRYILAHPDIAENIPQDALLVFQLENNPEFNEMSVKLAHQQQEPNQAVVKVSVERILPPLETRLVNPKLELAISI